MKKFKVWIEFEVEDTVTGEHTQITGDGGTNEAEPVPLGEFTTLKAAVDFAESLGESHRPHNVIDSAALIKQTVLELIEEEGYRPTTLKAFFEWLDTSTFYEGLDAGESVADYENELTEIFNDIKKARG